MEELLLEDSSGPTIALSLSKRPPPRPPKIGASGTGALGAGGAGGAAACPSQHISLPYSTFSYNISLIFPRMFSPLEYHAAHSQGPHSQGRSTLASQHLRGCRGRGSEWRLGQRKRSIVTNTPVLLVCLQGVLLGPGAASHPGSRRKSSRRGCRRSRRRRGGRRRSFRSRRCWRLRSRRCCRFRGRRRRCGSVATEKTTDAWHAWHAWHGREATLSWRSGRCRRSLPACEGGQDECSQE